MIGIFVSRGGEIMSIERTKELLKKLQDGIKQVQSGDEFKRVLSVMAKFHNYSFSNSMLIFIQYPQATRIAGFRTWNKLGRQVKKGEKAIWILAPMNVKKKDNDD